MLDLVLNANVAIDWFVPSEVGEAYSRPLVKLAEQGKIRFFVPLRFDIEVKGRGSGQFVGNKLEPCRQGVRA